MLCARASDDDDDCYDANDTIIIMLARVSDGDHEHDGARKMGDASGPTVAAPTSSGAA